VLDVIHQRKVSSLTSVEDERLRVNKETGKPFRKTIRDIWRHISEKKVSLLPHHGIF